MEHVVHLHSGEWEAFAAGHLPAARAAELKQHLTECGACRVKAGWTSPTLATQDEGPVKVVPFGGDELSRGTVIGRFVVLERLGAGGMGMVYAAYDPQLDRKIALKLLRRDLGRNQQQFRTRMLREAQAMARLSHPNVIAVHDVGTYEDRVFLAMELVEGGTVKAWLRQKRPSVREILDVFIAAGRGLASAHAAGLVHRDFKPENVLLGSDGRARVTDFGLARTAVSKEEPATPIDAPTPRPDAAETRPARKIPSEAIDTVDESDSRSATGAAAGAARPADAAVLADDAADAALRDAESETRAIKVTARGALSTERNSNSFANEANASAADDGDAPRPAAAVDAGPPTASQPGDGIHTPVPLDTPSLDIALTRAGTMMGTPGYMPPEQCQGGATDARADQFSFCASLYEALYGYRAFPGHTPEEIIDSVIAGQVRPAPAETLVPAWVHRALLRGLAIDPAARWPSMDALLEELARDPARRRRRWLVAASIGVAVGALVVSAQQYGARAARPCQGAARHLIGVWDDTHRQGLRSSFAKSGKVFAPKAAAAAEAALDEYANAWVGMHTDACEATRLRGEQSEPTMELRMACLDDRRQQLGALTQLFSSADDDTVERAVSAVEALPPVQSCADVRALAQVTPEPADQALRAQIAAAREKLASARALLGSGKYAPGLAIAEEVPPVAASIGYRPLGAEALQLVGMLRFKSSDYHGAERAWRDALYEAEEARADEVKSAAAMQLARVSVDVRGFGEAHEWLRFAEAAIKHVATGNELQVELWIQVAGVWFRESRYPEAEKAARKAVTLASQVLPDKHLTRASAYRILGDVLKYEGRYDDGLQLLEKARVILEAQLGPDHPEVGQILRKEIDVYSMRHDGASGLALGRRVLSLLSKSLPPDHLIIAQTHTNLAESLGILGRYEEALSEEHLALPTYVRIFGAESEDVGVSFTNTGYALMQLGRDDEARRDLTRAIAIYEKTLSAGAPDLAEPLLRLGQLELRHRRWVEAQKLLERALTLRQKDRDPTEMLAEIEQALGQTLLATGGRARAIALLERAHDQLRDAGKESEAAAVAARLAQARR